MLSNILISTLFKSYRKIFIYFNNIFIKEMLLKAVYIVTSYCIKRSNIYQMININNIVMIFKFNANWSDYTNLLGMV